MQPANLHTQTPDVLTHPEAAEWMALLYHEHTPGRKRELEAHLDRCPTCAAQVEAWRGSARALDDWTLPATQPVRRPKLPPALFPSPWSFARSGRRPALTALKWAAAAVLVLGLGFGLGRRSAPHTPEVAELKAAVAQLAATVQSQESLNSSHSLSLATMAAAAETLRVLSEYSQVQDAQRAADQQAVKLALETLNGRLEKLHAELETVAVNTQDGLQLTHQNLARLVSYSAPAEAGLHSLSPESQPRN